MLYRTSPSVKGKSVEDKDLRYIYIMDTCRVTCFFQENLTMSHEMNTKFPSLDNMNLVGCVELMIAKTAIYLLCLGNV